MSESTEHRWGWWDWSMALLAALVLIAWPAMSHSWWTQGKQGLHAIPALFLGLVVLSLSGSLIRAFLSVRRHGLRWLVSREAFRLLAATLALVLSFVALFYGIELWRGKHAYARATERATQLAEPLNLREAQAIAVPDDENLLSIPMLAPLYRLDDGALDSTGNLAKADLGPVEAIAEWGRYQCRRALNAQISPLWMLGSRLPLDDRIGPAKQLDGLPASTNEAQRATSLIAQLAPFAESLDAMAEASRRPFCRFRPSDINPIFSYRDAQITELFVGFIHLYEVRGLARLRTGDTDAAFADVQAGLQLARHLLQEPSLSYNEEMRARSIAGILQPLWEGMADGVWNDAQLIQLRRRSSEIQPLSELTQRFRHQRLAHADLVEMIVPTRRQAGKLPPSFRPEDLTALRWVRRFYPRGWSLLDQAAIHNFYFDRQDALNNPPAASASPEHRFALGLLQSTSDPCFGVFIAPKIVQMTHDSLEYLSFSQAVLTLADIACSLERHRLSSHCYPQTLEALQPNYPTGIPGDPITRGPLHYQRTPEGGYLLYSVALDAEDNFGHPPTEQTSDFSQPNDVGDWVWPMPARAASR